MSVNFKKEGSIYFAAVGCTRRQIRDIGAVQRQIHNITQRIYTKDTFLVSSVTTAARALIMQSLSSSGFLEITGDVQGLVPGSLSHVSADVRLQISSMRDAFFIKPWSENVSVFFGLWRFEKLQSGFQPASLVRGAPARMFAHDLLLSERDQFNLRKVTPMELASNEEEED